MNADGTNVQRVTNDAADDRHPNWCPSCDDRIAFASNRDGVNYSIYVTNVEGTQQVRLTVQSTGNTAPDDNPAWSGLPMQMPVPVVLSPVTDTGAQAVTGTGGGGAAASDSWLDGLLGWLGQLFGR